LLKNFTDEREYLVVNFFPDDRTPVLVNGGIVLCRLGEDAADVRICLITFIAKVGLLVSWDVGRLGTIL
jgi:hypothetical protein